MAPQSQPPDPGTAPPCFQAVPQSVCTLSAAPRWKGSPCVHAAQSSNVRTDIEQTRGSQHGASCPACPEQSACVTAIMTAPCLAWRVRCDTARAPQPPLLTRSKLSQPPECARTGILPRAITCDLLAVIFRAEREQAATCRGRHPCRRRCA